jgi:hypothetical protein
MREIKFKAFSKDHKGIFDVDLIDFTYKTVRARLLASGITIAFKLDHVELMQYTGLKDKNGIEVYEGYIVSYEDYFQKERRIVCWDRSSLIKLGISLAYCLNYNGESYIVDGYSRSFDVEIIGNIYENPEILERFK